MAPASIDRLGVIGLNRFGLGARPGDLVTFGGDVRSALLDEVAHKEVAIPSGENILSSPDAYHRLHVEQEQIQALRKAEGQVREAQASPQPQAPMPSDANAMSEPKAKTTVDLMAERRQIVREMFRAETVARVEAGTQARCGFSERLVLFWSNHFCISARKAGVVRVLAGPYEREAIRPHVFGRFADMLLAAEKHPAMLVYLDNEQSIGPNSKGGQRLQKGLNENLAREIMELHTLGVDGGYSQEDVTALARILTGWRFARNEKALAEEGHFLFNPNLHEPGDHRLLGVVYRDSGIGQGEGALLALARQPATARHIARKLAVHFVSDTPDPALVSRLEKTFLATEGDLAEVSKALILSPEAWREEQTKLRTPYEFLLASFRLTGAPVKAPLINGSLISMGQPLWSPPGPNGFSDLSDAWASPEGMKARLDFAARLAQFVPGDGKPTDLLAEGLGPLASDETRNAVARAESRAQGLALLLMSPEFQRR